VSASCVPHWWRAHAVCMGCLWQSATFLAALASGSPREVALSQAAAMCRHLWPSQTVDLFMSQAPAVPVQVTGQLGSPGARWVVLQTQMAYKPSIHPPPATPTITAISLCNVLRTAAPFAAGPHTPLALMHVICQRSLLIPRAPPKPLSLYSQGMPWRMLGTHASVLEHVDPALPFPLSPHLTSSVLHRV
jgi:hypothetical protein